MAQQHDLNRGYTYVKYVMDTALRLWETYTFLEFDNGEV